MVIKKHLVIISILLLMISCLAVTWAWAAEAPENEWAAPLQSQYPGTPVLYGTAKTDNGICVYWSSVEGADYYCLYRRTTDSFWEWTADVFIPQYTDADITLNTTYYYTVTAVDISDGGTVAVSGYDYTGVAGNWDLETPCLYGTVNSQGGIAIAWSYVDGADSYFVYRTTPSGVWELRANVYSAQYTDSDINPGEEYYYTVLAAKTWNGETVLSGYDPYGVFGSWILDTPVLYETANTDTGIQVSWGEINGADYYAIYRREENGYWEWIADVYSSQYTDSNIELNVTYYYTVLAVNTSLSNDIIMSMYDLYGIKGCWKVETPVLVGVVKNGYGSTVSWRESPEADYYLVFRRPDGGDYEYLGYSYWTEFSDTDTIAIAGNFYYSVIAVKTINGRQVYSDCDWRGVSSNDPVNILFIGNSLTYADASRSVPGIVKELAALNGRAAQISWLAYNNASLNDYISGWYRRFLDGELRARKYDYIVLQEKSERGADLEYGYLEDFENMMYILAQYGQQDAQIIIYSIHGCAHTGLDYTDYELRNFKNAALAKALINDYYPDVRVDIAKVGEMHLRIWNAEPNVSIMQDRNHPSYEGYYAAAMRIYHSIWNETPVAARDSVSRYIYYESQTLSLNMTRAALNSGGNIKLEAYDPSGGEISWYSFDNSVANVAFDGTVTGVNPERTVIIAQSSSGLQEACVVDVW